MIFEYMEYGDLTEVLRNSSEQFMNYSASLPLLDRVSANSCSKRNENIYTVTLITVENRIYRLNVAGLTIAHIVANIGGHEVFGQSTVRAQRLGVPELFSRQELVCENRRLRDEQRHIHLRLLQGMRVDLSSATN